MSELEALENIMTGYAGFFAKSVIKHQMKLLGMRSDDYTPAEIQQLGEKVITVAIFDTARLLNSISKPNSAAC